MSSINHHTIEYKEGEEGFFCVNGKSFGKERQTQQQQGNDIQSSIDQNQSSSLPVNETASSSRSESVLESASSTSPVQNELVGDTMQDNLFLQNFQIPANLISGNHPEALLACLNHFKSYHSNHISHLEKLYYANLAESIAKAEKQAVNAGALQYFEEKTRNPMFEGDEGSSTLYSPSPKYIDTNDVSPAEYDDDSKFYFRDDGKSVSSKASSPFQGTPKSSKIKGTNDEDPNLIFHRRSLLQRHRQNKKSNDNGVANETVQVEELDEEEDLETKRQRLAKKLAKNVPSMLSPERQEATKVKPFISKQKFEKYIAELKEREDRELAKQFKANPIPKSSIKPRYAKIMQELREKSLAKREARKQQLLTGRKEFRLNSAASGNTTTSKKKVIPTTEELQMAQLKNFRANALSPEVLAPSLDLETKEKERQERIRQRAQALLQVSSLPSRMAMDPALDPSNRRKVLDERDKISGLTSHHTFHPSVNTHIPNFERMQQEFQQRLQNLKIAKHSEPKKVSVKPFSFLQQKQHNNQDNNIKVQEILKEMEADDLKLRETRWPFLLPRKKVDPVSPPETTYQASSNNTVQITKSVEMARQARLKRDQEIQEQKEREETQREERKLLLAGVRERVHEIMRPVIETQSLDRNAKLEKMKKERLEAEALYRQNLNHLRVRVMTKPLMLQERTSITVENNRE